MHERRDSDRQAAFVANAVVARTLGTGGASVSIRVVSN